MRLLSARRAALQPPKLPPITSAAVQSGTLWRPRCINGTLATNYRVGHYHVDYTAQTSQAGDQSQLHHPYAPPAIHDREHRQHVPYLAPVHHGGSVMGAFHHNSSPNHGAHIPSPTMEHVHHQPQRQPSSLLMDGSSLRHHLETPSFVTQGTSMYTDIAPSSHIPQSPVHLGRIKRPHSDDLEASAASIVDMPHNTLDDVPNSNLGVAYGQEAAPTVAQGHAHLHHHHRQPDSEPLAKVVRREESWVGAPSQASVVGHPGMPDPAARPSGPKLKFTSEDDTLLVDLKENKNLTWKQIADFFPGRSSGTLQVRYCTKLKSKTTNWTDEMDQKLRIALQDYENEKWRIVSSKLGPGCTPAACRERAAELSGELSPLVSASPPMPASDMSGALPMSYGLNEVEDYPRRD